MDSNVVVYPLHIEKYTPLPNQSKKTTYNHTTQTQQNKRNTKKWRETEEIRTRICLTLIAFAGLRPFPPPLLLLSPPSLPFLSPPLFLGAMVYYFCVYLVEYIMELERKLKKGEGNAVVMVRRKMMFAVAVCI